MMKTSRETIQPYVTKDGSLIRELLHPALHGNRSLSLAEAIVAPGAATVLHRHHRAEEIYHVLAGSGCMTLGTERFSLAPEDTVCIAPGRPHRVENTGAVPLRILCCCAPAYAHDDAELLG
ncbi:MAG: cupin domain-containing protein [Desulfobulbaceae bacterium]